MGYNVMNCKSSLLITKDNVPKALDALRALPGWDGGAESDTPDLVFQDFGLHATQDEQGNLTALFLATEHLGDDAVAAFQAIAPFVEAGSYVMFIGEDAAQWAWVFSRNPETGAVEAHEESVILVLASEYERLTRDKGRGSEAPRSLRESLS
jgi:hypothetical protein